MIEIKAKNFQPIKPDLIYIKADKNKNHTKTLQGGTEIWIDPLFNRHSTELVTQDGEVVYISSKITGEYPLDIKVGDKVYTHHFLCDPENEVEVNGELLYQIAYRSIYCVIDNGEIRMIQDYNLIEPIVEDEAEFTTPAGILTKSTPDVVKLIGIARHVCPELAEQGVEPGDKVVYRSVADYEMHIEGKTYYKMETRDIQAVIKQ
jgi:co-chaperonin GroES (HSP10)